MIRGELVDLRPLTAADLERAESVANDPDYNGAFGTFALEGAFTREGVLRRAQWRLGAWHDVCIHSKLRGE